MTTDQNTLKPRSGLWRRWQEIRLIGQDPVLGLGLLLVGAFVFHYALQHQQALEGKFLPLIPLEIRLPNGRAEDDALMVDGSYSDGRDRRAVAIESDLVRGAPSARDVSQDENKNDQ